MKSTLTDPTGQPYVAGCLPRVSKLGDGTFRVFDPAKAEKGLVQGRAPKLTREIVRALIWHHINQKQQGSCCASAGCHHMEFQRQVAGLKQIPFAQSWLYGLGNGGRDQGMAIDTCLKLLITDGCCPATLIDQYDWMGYKNGTWPAEAKAVSQQYRAVESFDVATIEDAKWGLKRGFPFLYGAKGHAVNKLTEDENDDWNTWGLEWEDRGIGLWATWAEIKRALPMYGGFFVRVATDPDDDGDLPKPR